ncbi:FAD/NAD(P)-binding protein [Streptomyces sp. NPDC001034]|uniref:FAD/NAD(P)-binding protein n=1 Tax=Streptomyces sp. NPDC001034 TaxID=3154375 RepID=UPI003317A5DC
MSQTAGVDRAPVLVLIGAGPRGTGLLERIAVNAAELLPDTASLAVHVVDPFPAGSGRVWRAGQSPLLWMNSRAEDITMFTDDSVDCAGRPNPGPTLHAWAREHGRAIADDPGLAAEAGALGPASFASRRLAGAYLRWCFRRAAAELPPNVRLVVHEARAVGLTDRPDGGQVVTLSTGTAIRADLVVLALGNQRGGLDERQRAFAALADHNGGGYLPPSYTADVDLDLLPAGGEVIVSGIGQAFADLMVLVTEGRGGVFARDTDGTLRYRPSGREPVLRVGSRRGLPASPKPAQSFAGTRVEPPRFATAERLKELVSADAPGGADVLLGIVCKELGWAYYRELFLANPARTCLPWGQFSREFAGLDWYDPRMARLVARAVPDPEDRMDLPPERSPLANRAFADEPALCAWMDAHLRRGVRRATEGRYSGQAAALGALVALVPGLLGVLTTGEGLPDHAAAAVLGPVTRLAGLFGSGLPPYRFEQLRALSAAGVVRYLGANLTLTADEPSGLFVARSTCLPGVATARHLVEARLPHDDILADGSALLTGLVLAGRGRAVRSAAAVRLAVDERSFAVEDRAGRSDPRRFALGAFATGGALGALSMPHSDAPFFRQNDALARRILHELAPPRNGR